jgi:hypothetical protein
VRGRVLQRARVVRRHRRAGRGPRLRPRPAGGK